MQEAVKYSIPFQLFAEINKKIIIPKKFMNVKYEEEEGTGVNHRKNILGTLGIELVQSHMLRFPSSDNVQLIGLDIILKCLEEGSDQNTFIDQNFAKIYLHAITMRKIEVKWRAYVAFMKLTTSRQLCKTIETLQGCEILLNDLKQLFQHGSERHDSILQFALWSLSNICNFGKLSYHTIIYLFHSVNLAGNLKVSTVCI